MGVNGIFYCTTIAYHVERNADLGWPTSKKNRHLVLAGAPQEGEPRSEIPLDLPSCSLAAIYTSILLQGKKFNFFHVDTLVVGH